MIYLFLPLLLVYAALIGILYGRQRQLIYHPSTSIAPPEYYGLEGFGEYVTATSDRQSLQLWYRAAREGFPTVVYYHGNASHMGGRAGMYMRLAEKGFGVLGVSYRGYGKSTGS